MLHLQKLIKLKKKNSIKLEGEVDRAGEYEWKAGIKLLDRKQKAAEKRRAALKDDNDTLLAESNVVETAKRLALFLLDEGLCEFAQDLKHQQIQLVGINGTDEQQPRSAEIL